MGISSPESDVDSPGGAGPPESRIEWKAARGGVHLPVLAFELTCGKLACEKVAYFPDVVHKLVRISSKGLVSLMDGDYWLFAVSPAFEFYGRRARHDVLKINTRAASWGMLRVNLHHYG